MTGRVVLVTGASSGIGRATAHGLSRCGDHLFLLSRSAGPLEETATECRDAGAASATTLVADVGDDDAVRDAVAEVVAIHGRLDVVVNSAAVVAYGRVEDVPVEVYDRVHRTNVLGSVNVARHVVPVLRQQGYGTLVLIGSVLGEIAVPQMSAYVTTKWAIRALARHLQIENRDVKGMSICLVTPGGVDTPVYAQAATSTGSVGRPPPPVDSPEKVARAVVRTIDHPRRVVDVGVANPLMVLGFTVLPRVFDALVGPLFSMAAQDRRQPATGPGNVLQPQPELEQIKGGQGSSVVSIAAQLVTMVRRG